MKKQYLVSGYVNLSTCSQQRVHRVANGLFPGLILNPQQLTRPLVVVVVRAGDVLPRVGCWQLRRKLGMCLSNGLCNILIGDETTGDEESFSTRLCHLNGLDVGQGHISYINIQVAIEAGLLILQVPLHKVLGPLVGSVDGVQGVKVVHNGAQD